MSNIVPNDTVKSAVLHCDNKMQVLVGNALLIQHRRVGIRQEDKSGFGKLRFEQVSL
jgi:hypothetical protein